MPLLHPPLHPSFNHPPIRQFAEAAPSKKQYDYTDEKLHFEGGPHGGDLAINLALGATLLWLPLTAAAVGRAAFIKYRFTDRRISVTTDAPWQSERGGGGRGPAAAGGGGLGAQALARLRVVQPWSWAG